MSLINTILNYLVAHPDFAARLTASAGVLSASLETFLTKLKINGKKLSFTLSHLFAAGAATAAHYLGGANAAQTVGIYAALWPLTQVWHRFVISGLSAKLQTYLAYLPAFLQFVKSQQVPSTSNSNVTEAKPFTLDSVNQPVAGK